jgi:hypothetical protein
VSLANRFNRDNGVESLPFVKVSDRRKITQTPNALSHRATMRVIESVKEVVIVSPAQVVLNLVVEVCRHRMIGLFLIALER